MRSRHDSAVPASAMPRHSAVTADPVWSPDAPRLRIAWTTSAIVPPKPTSAAISAEDQAGTGGRLRSIASIVWLVGVLQADVGAALSRSGASWRL